MAGFDLDNVRGGVIPGAGPIEMGTMDFTAGGRTVEVVTRLNTCWMGFGIADSTQTTEGVHNLIASTDADVSAGNITFYRHGPYVGAAAKFHYVLVGW